MAPPPKKRFNHGRTIGSGEFIEETKGQKKLKQGEGKSLPLLVFGMETNLKSGIDTRKWSHIMESDDNDIHSSHDHPIMIVTE